MGRRVPSTMSYMASKPHLWRINSLLPSVCFYSLTDSLLVFQSTNNHIQCNVYGALDVYTGLLLREYLRLKFVYNLVQTVCSPPWAVLYLHMEEFAI